MKQKGRTAADAGSRSVSEAARPGGAALLVLLGFAASLWALFLWAELVIARTGGPSICAFGDAGRCAALWDSSFAGAIHRATGLPIAGWGLVWGVAATLLPLQLLRRAASGLSSAPWISAVRIVAAAGFATVLLMIGASISAGGFCGSCAVTYLLVTAYAAATGIAWRGAAREGFARGAVTALATAAAAFVLLLYPGMKTPEKKSEAGRRAIETAPGAAADVPPSGSPETPDDRHLQEFIASLSPDLKQTLADSLFIYRRSQPQPLPPPRYLIGAPDAPVRITTFTDVLCTHCADLHRTMAAMRDRFAAGAFSYEPRQFPLDGRCNALVAAREGDPVRCAAAKAEICAEGSEKFIELSGRLYEEQAKLSASRVGEIVRATAPAAGRCAASSDTQSKLQEDVTLASRFDPEGTPIVLVNGRKGTSFPPFLYAMVLTRGAPYHSAFALLPPPNPEAHLH
jgi:serine/threonine-protein kinase